MVSSKKSEPAVHILLQAASASKMPLYLSALSKSIMVFLLSSNAIARRMSVLNECLCQKTLIQPLS